MTLQQMEYLVALDMHRQFVKAAEACGVSQSTLSTMIKKLEEELDTIIFDRDAHPICPTPAGGRIIAQARVVLYNMRQLSEMALSERLQSCGEIRLAVIPTVAADIIPKLFRSMREDSPQIQLRTSEMMTCDILDKFSRAEFDMAVMATPLHRDNLLEIPLYYEKFFVYVSPSDPLAQETEISSGELSTQRMWILKEGNCFRDQVLNFCHDGSAYSARYEAGSIDTLVRIVDENGGYTVIPELHIPFLNQTQRANVRPLVRPDVVREVSLVIRRDFVRERMLNEVARAVRKAVPEHMIDRALKKFAIRL